MLIETPRLILRPFSVNDAQKYFEITREADIKKFVPFACPNSVEESINYIETCYSKTDFKNDFYFIIEEKSSKQIIGAIFLTGNFYLTFHEFCYFIYSPFRNKGYMKEAILACLSEINLPEKNIFFIIKKDNIASLNLIQKLPNVKELPVVGKEYLISDEKVFYYLTENQKTPS